MKAARVHRFGPPDVVVIEELERDKTLWIPPGTVPAATCAACWRTARFATGKLCTQCEWIDRYEREREGLDSRADGSKRVDPMRTAATASAPPI
jgi:hypothetical protein